MSDLTFIDWDTKTILENIKTGNKTAIQNSRFKEEGAKNGR